MHNLFWGFSVVYLYLNNSNQYENWAYVTELKRKNKRKIIVPKKYLKCKQLSPFLTFKLCHPISEYSSQYEKK